MRTNKAQGATVDAGLLQARRHLSDRAIQNIFIWPTLLLLIAMNVFPLLYSLYLTLRFTQRTLTKKEFASPWSKEQ